MDELRRHYPTGFHEWFAYFIHDSSRPLLKMHQVIAPLVLLRSRRTRPSREELIEIGQQLTDNLVELNAIIAGVSHNMHLEGLVVEREEFLLEDTVATVLRLVGNLAEAKEITIDYEPSARPILVAGDSVLTRRVIRNILDNALEYTQDRGHITIETAASDRWAQITITDNGPGIPKHSMNWLFSPGFRVGGERRHDIDGRGLGLAFVKRAVELQGGKVTVESEPGKGAQFRIRLPASGDGINAPKTR